MSARLLVILAFVVTALATTADEKTDETPSALARRICQTDEMMGLAVTGACYENVYRTAAKAQLAQYVAIATAQSRAIALHTEMDAWQELGTIISAAIRNATCG